MSKFTDARHQIAGNTWLDNLARASLTAADQRFGDGGRQAFLAVDLDRDINADDLSIISRSLQNAVARIGKYITNPNSEAVQIRESDREFARLYPRGQFGRRLEFVFDSPANAETHLLYLPSVETAAERATTELIEMLPGSEDFPHFSTTILARDRAARNAVQDIASAVQETSGISMKITTHVGENFHSIVTPNQASEISKELKNSAEVERDTITVDGRIDGMRTRRRIFFLETPTTDYEGAFEVDLVDDVKRYIDQPVTATIERVRPLKKTGPRGRWSYRLIGIKKAPMGLLDTGPDLPDGPTG